MTEEQFKTASATAKYISRKWCSKIHTEDDLYQQIMLNAVIRTPKFNPDRGSYSTYINIVARHAVQTYIVRDRIVALPTSTVGRIKHDEQARVEMKNALGESMTNDEGSVMDLRVEEFNYFDDMSRVETTSKAAHALSKATKLQQGVWLATVFFGKTSGDIASHLKVSKQMVSAHKCLARDVIAEHFDSVDASSECPSVRRHAECGKPTETGYCMKCMVSVFKSAGIMEIM